MKFTDGYWLLRKQYRPVYAVECGGSRIGEDSLVLYGVSHHINSRSDSVGVPTITVKLTAPRENVIKLSLVHYAGAVYRGPFVEVSCDGSKPVITEEEDTIEFRSGNLRAVVDKRPNSWGIRFYEGDRYLTDTGYRNMASMQDTVTGKSYMLEQLAIDGDECIYGLGERFTPFVRNGQSVDMWQGDGGTASDLAYKNIPFFLSNKGYGVLVDNEGDISYEIASEKVERIQFSAEGERLDYYFIAGSDPMDALTRYCALTGKPALPPAWSFGLWLTTSFTTNYDEATTSSFIEGMKERDIPLHVFHFDCYWMEAYEWCNFKWDPATFPDPAGMLKRYHDKGLHICVWINSYIGQKSPLFDEAAEKGYLIRRADGSIWQSDLWQPGGAVIDFTNPGAVEWYQSKLKVLLDMGVDCFKTDFGERIPVRDVVYYDGSDPVKMHNYYTFLYNKAVFDLLLKERGEGEAVLFARSATACGQQFPVHWGGDSTATFASMRESLRGGLSLASSGFAFWSHDIGGFEQTASADVYKRWCAFGLLSTHSRLHGSQSYRVPWLFDDEACDVLRYFTKLKCTLMPYLYGQAVRAAEEGRPVMRPMFLAYPEDLAAMYLDKQYMLGDTLLVAPVFKESGDVDYYLPEGTWINVLTGEAECGGRYVHKNLDYFGIPLMAAPNSILAVGNRDDVPDYDYADGVALCLTDFEDGCIAKTFVPDTKGRKVLEVTACRSGSRITVTVKGGKNYTVKLLEKNREYSVAAEGETAVVTLGS